VKYYFKPSFKSSRDNVKCKLCEDKIELGQMIRFEPFMRVLAHEACVEGLATDEQATTDGGTMQSVADAIDRLSETLKSNKQASPDCSIDTTDGIRLISDELAQLSRSINSITSELSALSQRLGVLEEKLGWVG
jgi:hypothetical protein